MNSFRWSLHRELWESRSIYIGPLIVAALLVFAFLISTFAHNVHARQIQNAYDLTALAIMGTTFLVSVFYCLDALNSERRDRSILFWKSMPVSDLTTVLAKASIPLVVLPLLTFAITIVTQLMILLISSAAGNGSGRGVATLWNTSPIFNAAPGLLYHLLAVHSLYYAPIFGWLLVVSAWARRATFLWAVLPLFVIGAVERITFNTTHFGNMLANRMNGGGQRAKGMSMDLMPHGGAIHFLISPGMWIGLLLAAAFLAAAVRLRRTREPI